MACVYVLTDLAGTYYWTGRGTFSRAGLRYRRDEVAVFRTKASAWREVEAQRRGGCFLKALPGKPCQERDAVRLPAGAGLQALCEGGGKGWRSHPGFG